MQIWTTPQLNELLAIGELPLRLFPGNEVKKNFLNNAQRDDFAVIGIDDDYLNFLAAARERGIISPILFVSPEPIMYESELRRYNALVLDLKKMGTDMVSDIVHYLLFIAQHYHVPPSVGFPPLAPSSPTSDDRPVEGAAAILKQLTYLHKADIPMIVAMDIYEYGVPVSARGACAIKTITDSSIVLNRFKQPAFFQAVKKGRSLKMYYSYRQLNHEAIVDIHKTTDTEIHVSLPDRLFVKKDIRIQPNPNKPVALHVIVPGEPTTGCKVIDISTRGIGFLCSRNFPVDSVLSLTIQLPDPHVVILSTGIIRYKKESMEGIRYGAEIRPHPWDEENIAKYVMKREAEIICLLRS